MKTAGLILLTICNAGLIWILVASISTQIRINDETAHLEYKIKDKLLFIRDLQKVYKSQKGNYAKSWDDLTKFSNLDSIYLIAVKEINKFDEVSQIESSVQLSDTLGVVSVFDSLFDKSIYTPGELDKVPGLTDVQFNLKTDLIKHGNSSIENFLIQCPVPTNLNRNKRKLAIGSLERVSLAGNWY